MSAVNPQNHYPILESIIPSFRDNAILLGLMDSKWHEENYSTETFSGHVFRVAKITLPNGYARLDILYIDNEAVGSIVCCQLVPGLYHMAGLYVRDQYRSSKIFDVFPKLKNSGKNNVSPATFVLKGFLLDISHSKSQVCLEVLNSNEPAWNLYERKSEITLSDSTSIRFELLSKQEILSYASIRGKKIGKWHEIETEKGACNLGVQWSHVPEFGNSTRWSINRVYVFKGRDQEFIPIRLKAMKIRANIRLIWSIFRWGAIRKYLRVKIDIYFGPK